MNNQQIIPVDQRITVDVAQFRDIDNGMAVLLHTLQSTSFVGALSIAGMNEQECIQLFAAMKGNSSVERLEVHHIIISPPLMSAIAELKDLKMIEFLDDAGVEDEAYPILANMLRGDGTLTELDFSNENFHEVSTYGLQVILETLKKQSSLKHLGLPLFSRKTEAKIADMLRVNESLDSLSIREDEYTREGLLEIESVLKHGNTTLTDLHVATNYEYFEPASRFEPYLKRNRNLKRVKCLEKAPKAVLGSAIGRIVSDDDVVGSASVVYWLLRNNVETIAVPRGADALISASKRARRRGLDAPMAVVHQSD